MIYKYNYLGGASFGNMKGLLHIYLFPTVSLPNQEHILLSKVWKSSGDPDTYSIQCMLTCCAWSEQ